MSGRFIAELYVDALGPGVSCRWEGTDEGKMKERLEILLSQGRRVAFTDDDGNIWLTGGA